jgi:hypothetical protein
MSIQTRARVTLAGLLGFAVLGRPMPAQINFQPVYDAANADYVSRHSQHRDPPEPRDPPSPPEPLVGKVHPTDPKEAEKRVKEENDKIHQMQKNWLSIEVPSQVDIPSRPIEFSFGTKGFGQKVSDPAGLVGPLGKIAMQGTTISPEALRRTTAILAVVQKSVATAGNSEANNEEAAFLAGQAALAMEGAPLQVIVEGRSLPAPAVGLNLMQKTRELWQQQRELERANAARVSEYAALKGIDGDVEGGRITAEQAAPKREEIKARFKKATEDTQIAQAHVAATEIVILRLQANN